jgi:hypothetical protein
MTARRIKSAIAGGMLVALATLATMGTAMSLEVFRSYSAGCARWSSQGAGQRIEGEAK